MGNSHPSVVPYTVYRARDGFVIVACGNDKQFIRLTAALAVPDLADHADFATNEMRIKNREQLDGILADIILKMDRQQLIEKLEAAGVSCGPINNISEVFADRHVQARGARIDQWRKDGSKISTTAFAAKLSLTPAQYRAAPPRLGEHSDQVIAEWADMSLRRDCCLAQCQGNLITNFLGLEQGVDYCLNVSFIDPKIDLSRGDTPQSAISVTFGATGCGTSSYLKAG